MITLLLVFGVALVVVGLLVAKLHMLLIVGLVGLGIAAVLIILGAVGRPVGGLRRWR